MCTFSLCISSSLHKNTSFSSAKEIRHSPKEEGIRPVYENVAKPLKRTCIYMQETFICKK